MGLVSELRRREASLLKAIIFDIDGTLIESMAIDSKLYFSSVTTVLGPVDFRESVSDYDNVTDSGIISQLADDVELANVHVKHPHLRGCVCVFVCVC
jgi:hypothetical protein